MASEPTYSIIRMYFHHSNRVIKTGLTLEQAQAHCNHPETSSSTCTNSVGKGRTERMGPWFDGWEAE